MVMACSLNAGSPINTYCKGTAIWYFTASTPLPAAAPHRTMSNIDAREGGTVNNIQGGQNNYTHITYGTPVSLVADELEQRISGSISTALSGVRFVYDAASKASTFVLIFYVS